MNIPDPCPADAVLKGRLLIASPTLHGGSFDHSVVLLSQHSQQDGAFGLILNHPTGKVVGDLLKEQLFHPLRNISVHRGGPVADNNLFFAALWWEQKNGLRIINQISAAEAIKHQKKTGRLVRAFVGYSGWSPGQLENELESNSWIVTPPAPEILGLSHDQSLWAHTLRAMSPYHKILAEAPRNPYAN
jgi:putative transcriptional regulator